MASNLNRFIDAQERDYDTALSEIKNGRKRSHWMWYIFPQIQGLGLTDTSRYYAINDMAEAEAYLAHPVLGPRLIAISQALLKLPGSNATQVMGSPDDLKLRSSMTLFANVPGADSVFQAVLDKFNNGQQDTRTLQLI
ncbi:DUF1810 domain-containing protein [Mucilaginibacter lacusdianchii]|uniref:DUF1810 domain-containing protein n=1 Tax=Mucilaginibacter lacusdianchii TaxID=2684211 RepID=UPI00131D25DD|nr:DUF1810 domain-containing protein [Mucilaginibacter sp. JXJ CY 39]